MKRSRFPRIPQVLVCAGPKNARNASLKPKGSQAAVVGELQQGLLASGRAHGDLSLGFGSWGISPRRAETTTTKKRLGLNLRGLGGEARPKKASKKREQNLSREEINHRNISTQSCCFCCPLESFNPDYFLFSCEKLKLKDEP